MHLAHSAAHAVAARDLAGALSMWIGMSIAMMAPAAVPAMRAFAAIAAQRDVGATHDDAEHRSGPLGAFVAGYLVVWVAFGLLATAAQWMLTAAMQHATPADPAPLHAGGSTTLAGLLLVVAGLYQFSALKASCLRQCRSPVAFFLANWRAGFRGAFALGQRHGLHCLGCCWALMALMLIGGAMSLRWTALLTALVLAEKVAPAGLVIGRAVGLGLVGWGGALLALAART